MIKKELHTELFRKELIHIKNEWDKTLSLTAASMLKDAKLYVSKYVGYDKARGNILVKFNNKICPPPRKNELLVGFVPFVDYQNFNNWGALTYEKLFLENRYLSFETKPVFFKYEEDYTTIGFSGFYEEDIHKLKEGILIYFGPPEEPIEYINNLYQFIDTNSKSVELFNIEIEEKNWNPRPLNPNDKTFELIKTDFKETDYVIIQGPPGTGKTYLMSILCKELLSEGKKVLVTALTNRALVELAEKEHLLESLQNGEIYKSALSTDEVNNKKLKGIQSFRSIADQKPKMLLSSYFKMSEIASNTISEPYFDYVIIEEASQAFLSTIAITKKLGKKFIIIGDINQLEPIFHNSYDQEDKNNYHWMICGLKTISYFYRKAKQYILTDSYRLTPSTVNLTNLFYDGKLRSMSNINAPINYSKTPVLEQILNDNGGTSLLKVNFNHNRHPSKECIDIIVESIHQIKFIDKNAQISILTFLKESVRVLLREVLSRLNNDENVLIETIDRVQGLTTDYCILFIPLDSFPFSFQLNRFNVATSRAKKGTLIIVDEKIDNFKKTLNNSIFDYLNNIEKQIYLKEINFNKSITSIIGDKKVDIKIIDKIDLSKFEKPKKEISNDRDNIYIIDTNVFVEQPDIISKIDKKYQVVLSAKVIDELDSLKTRLNEEEKKNVQRALKNINVSIDADNVKMVVSDLSLLPEDFNKKSPDNMILSVALRYKDENPIVLTSDNGLQIKSKGLGLTTISLKDFLKQKR